MVHTVLHTNGQNLENLNNFQNAYLTLSFINVALKCCTRRIALILDQNSVLKYRPYTIRDIFSWLEVEITPLAT